MDSLLNIILSWQLKGFFLAFIALVVLSSLSFYAAKNRVLILRIALVSIGLMSLLQFAQLQQSFSIDIVSRSSLAMITQLLNRLAWPILGIFALFGLHRAIALFGQYLSLKRLVSKAIPVDQGDTHKLFTELLQQIDIGKQPNRPPELYISSEIQSACTFGFFKPKVLLSTQLAENPIKAEMAIIHELQHISRGDWIWEQLAQGVRIFFPADLLIKQLRKDHHRYIEEACDNKCLEFGLDPLNYADFLHRLSRDTPVSQEVAYQNPALVQAAELSGIGERVERLIQRNSPTQSLAPWQIAGLGLFLLSLALLLGGFNWSIQIVQPAEASPSNLVIYEGREELPLVARLPDNPMASPQRSNLELELPEINEPSSEISESITNLDSDFSMDSLEPLAPP